MDSKRIEAHWAVRERVAVCISANSSSQMLIARGARVAEGVGGELFVLHIDAGEDLQPEEKATLAANMQFARNLNAQVFTVKGKSVAHRSRSLCTREENHPYRIWAHRRPRSAKYLYYWAIQHFLKESPKVDVHIVTQHPERE